MNKLYNLSNPQYGIWLTEQFFQNTSIGNISGTIVIDNVVDFEKLEKALNIYVQRNDSIRLHFVILDDAKVKQYISDFSPFSISVIDIDKESFNTVTSKNATERFFLTDSNLYKFSLFRFPDNTGAIQVTFHHLIADAWTMSLFISETMSIYEKLLNNEEISTQKNPSYETFLEDENSYLNSIKFKQDQEFWNNVFNFEPEVAKLKEPENTLFPNTAAIRKSYTLEAEKYTQILDFCKINKISIFTFIISIYSIYLSKITNLDNVTIGTPILNRSNFIQKQTSGMFASTIPINMQIDKNISFIELAQTISQKQMSMFRHQKYPYIKLLETINNNYPNTGNLYDVCISYQNARDTNRKRNINYHTNWLFNGHISDSLDLHFYDMDNKNTLDIYYDYQIEKFNNIEIENIHNRILNIVDQVLLNKSIIINDIEIITKEEKDIILGFNNSVSDFPKDKNIIELFNEQVNINPNSIALHFENKSFTYKQLNDRANELAFFLQNNNIKSQDVVAIFMDKSIEAIISILAITKIGAIYLPIDIDYPDERISYILQDSNAKCIITSKCFEQKLNYNLPIYLADIDNSNIYNKEINNISTDISSDSIAYIMYTSGSTGKPKGVLITHKGIVRLVKNTNYITFNIGDKILQTGSIVFDACTFEIWGALLNGLELYLLKKSDLLNPIFFEKYILENNITTLFLTTALFNKFCEANPLMFKKLKYLLTGGEAVSKKHMKIAKEANPNLNIVHVYGPTENTTFSTYYNVTNNFNTIPIGFPIANTTCYIVSKLGGLEPLNTPGELLVGGDGVSKRIFK